MLVYLAGTITGLTLEQCQQWRKQLSTIISDSGSTPLDPTANLNSLYVDATNVIPVTPPGNAEMNSSVIFSNCIQDVLDCDVIFANLLDNPASIGTHFELGCYYAKRLLALSSPNSYSIIVIPEAYHYHPFVQCHDVVKSTLAEGIVVLKDVLNSNK